MHEVQKQTNYGDRNENAGYLLEEGGIDWEQVHDDGASRVLFYSSVRGAVLGV